MILIFRKINCISNQIIDWTSLKGKLIGIQDKYKIVDQLLEEIKLETAINLSKRNEGFSFDIKLLFVFGCWILLYHAKQNYEKQAQKILTRAKAGHLIANN
ncbi:hypothetical protein [Legionella sainthelensi]|uniref:hypothetical protein n=1 Tax=Legionella sainthelensi TaxID=28087 RepID=UPI00048845DA|nr:hypothetical protein [Legionella sainthelensi]